MKVKIRHNFDVNNFQVPEPKLEMFKIVLLILVHFYGTVLPSNIKNAETLCNLKVRIKK